MSLLLDALKRAEESKRAKEAPQTDKFLDTSPPREAVQPPKRPVPDLELSDFTETIPPPAARSPRPSVASPAPAPTPAAPAGLSGLTLAKAEVAAIEPPREPPVASRETSVASRDEARNIFISKQSSSSDGRAKAKWLLPVLAITLSAIGAGGWYVWNQTRVPTRGLGPSPATTPISTVAPAPIPASTPAPTTAPGAAPPPSTTIATASPPATPAPNGSLPPAAPTTGQPIEKAKAVAVASAPAEATIPPLLPPAAGVPKTPVPKPTLAPRTRPAESAAPAEALTERELLAKQLRQARVAKEAPVGLRLSRSMDAPKINPDIANAYQALSAGDFNQAKKLYSAALQTDPTSIDGHLGLATAHARLNDNALAVQHYRRVLELDPRNSTAVNGLIAVSSSTQPEQLENELRALLAKDANSAALHFSLGNVYAGERRWHEAQQSYFDAFRLQGDNADYVYNLAVSLDKLNQTRLANDYYQKALQLSAKGGVQFDRAQVQRRIDELRGG